MKTVTELVQQRADNYGERLAFGFLKNGEFEAGRLSYAELDYRSRTVAARLQQISNPGDRVMLMYSPGLEFISGFLGCLYAGVIAVPTSSPGPARLEKILPRISVIAENANTGIILTGSDQTDKLAALVRESKSLRAATIIPTDRLDPSLADHWNPVPSSKSSIALLQYTSGSTAEPKGVMVSHGNIMHNLEFIHEREASSLESTSVTWLPPFHDMGLLEGVLSPIYGIYPQFLMSPLAFIQRPVRWLQAISKYRATTSGAPNFAYQYCVETIRKTQREGLDLSSWRVAYNGSEPVNMETMKNFASTFHKNGFDFDAFCPVYGLAESTALATGTACGSGPAQRRLNGGRNETVTCGQAGKNSDILVVDPVSCQKCGQNEEGEIWLSGPSVARGYWNNPVQTDETFGAFVADSDEGPYLRSGDLGYLVDGNLYVTGRIKELIILRGRKLFPQDIEHSASRAHALIHNRNVAAFSIDVEQGEQLVLLAELDLRQVKKLVTGGKALSVPLSIDFQAIAFDLVQAISNEHEVRVSTTLLMAPGQIPKTSSGKVQRSLCRNRFLETNIDYMFRWDTTTLPLDVSSQAG